MRSDGKYLGFRRAASALGVAVALAGLLLTGIVAGTLDQAARSTELLLGSALSLVLGTLVGSAAFNLRKQRDAVGRALAHADVQDGLRRAVEAIQRASLDAIEQGVMLSDLDGKVLLLNRSGERILGHTASELNDASRAGEVTLHEHAADQTAVTGDPVVQKIVGWKGKDGAALLLRVSTEPVRDDAGTFTSVVTGFFDVTTALATDEALAVINDRFAALVERSTDIICVIDALGRLTYASPASERVLGFAPGSRYGDAFTSFVHPDDVDRLADEFRELSRQPAGVRATGARLADARGGWRDMEIIATNRLHDPAVEGIVVNLRDVTERTEAAARLTWQAFHDTLTGLPNRTLLLDRLAHALARSKRADEQIALLFLDLDDFKAVNDTGGHAAGDQLLIEVAARLSRIVRADDTVARFGGDEFVVLAESLAEPGDAEALAGRIIDALAAPIDLPLGPVQISASIGIAINANHHPDGLLRDADAALYRAKHRGRNRYEVFDDSLRLEAAHRLSYEQLLRRALDDGLVVHYQPIFDLHTGVLVSAEALLRMPSPDGHLQGPAEFIAAAEESGLIVAIGAGVLDDACANLARWRLEHGHEAPASIAVNVSSRQLASPAFVDLVSRTLAAHGLLASDLVLELTESTVVAADRSTTRTVERLDELGVGLSIDDFGTGYSSLAFLKRFPISSVKLDQSFVSGLSRDADDTEIVRAVTGLGRALGLIVIAEGIETREQLTALRDLGCDCGQGYLLAAPGPADQLTGSLANKRDLFTLTSAPPFA